ncbi:hypothetical protein [Streptomyces sp. 5-6(2022)]|uniref:hypothetical protein n=1 Tax=Streptomyces sp. 5-6(2022) TaxID=2936510 RepID=UPI0023B8F9C5|nr:hypothetical protein [Streptomyces sp. 5-6(2022)]
MAIVRDNDPDAALRAVLTLAEEGIEAIEISLTTNDAPTVIARARAELGPETLLALPRGASAIKLFPVSLGGRPADAAHGALQALMTTTPQSRPAVPSREMMSRLKMADGATSRAHTSLFALRAADHFHVAAGRYSRSRSCSCERPRGPQLRGRRRRGCGRASSNVPGQHI